jgi:hypothetical protein
MSTMADRASKGGARARQAGETRVTADRARAWVPGLTGPSTTDCIRARAYEIFRARRANGSAGDALSDWLQAERELGGTASEPSVADAVEIRASVRGEHLLATGK